MTRTNGNSGWNLGGSLVLVAMLVAAPLAWGQEALTASPAPIRQKRLVLVSIPDRKVAVLESGRVVGVFPVAVGAAVSPSPGGEFAVVNRVSQPTYYHPGVVVPPGKSNPLGTRWVGLNKKGYGIHGTNVPASIGKAASHGCIRLRNRDVEKFFEMVRVGDSVSIRGERDQQVAEAFGESHEPFETVAQAEEAGNRPVGTE